MKIKSRLFLIALALCAGESTLVADHVKTKKLQVLIDLTDPLLFMFALNNGTGIVNNPGAPRPLGAYYVGNGWILPGGTIKKSQTSYLVDKHGHTITQSDSLGRFETFAKMVNSVDFGNFPAEGTTVEMTEWGLYFKKECDNRPNLLMASGFGKTGVLELGEATFSWAMNVLPGSGCNHIFNVATAKSYTSLDGMSSLLKIKFHEEVVYKD